MSHIYKIVDRKIWQSAEASGAFTGAGIDLIDNYIHLSTAEQVYETAALHFQGIDHLVLVAVDPSSLGGALKYEPSRGGDLFPHLYGPLPLSAVVAVVDLPMDATGRHHFPTLP